MYSRRQQLKRLQDEVVDIEDMSEGISIMDLGLNEFRLDLLDYVKKHNDLDTKPHGMHAVVPACEGLDPGVIFVLKNRNQGVNVDKKNRIFFPGDDCCVGAVAVGAGPPNAPYAEYGTVEALYHELLKKNEGKPRFSLHDGPPYANGNLHAGTAMKDGNIVTNGGRVLCVTALGNTVLEAKQKAYRAINNISWNGMFHRNDIADRAIAREQNK